MGILNGYVYVIFVRKTVELLLKGEFVRLDKFPRIKLAEDKEELKEQTIKKLKEKKLL